MTASTNRALEAMHKLVRFAAIYGPGRALVKAMGRLRRGRIPVGLGKPGGPSVAIVGCGQFAFSTIAYFLRGRAELRGVFDLDDRAARSLAKAYGVNRVYASIAEIGADAKVKCVYVASNHASHAPYAIELLAAGKDVYIEKPIAVSLAQLRSLLRAAQGSQGRVFAGYNRPFAKALADLRQALGCPVGPMTLSCFVAGHALGPDHWYRRPEEGTRICGNVGHWLDLAVHLVSWRNLPDSWRIDLTWSDIVAADDNLAIAISSEAGDLVNIVMSSRSEPFEGISETICLQWGPTLAKIEDFRTQTIWTGSSVRRHRYWPKDVGHRHAVSQPLEPRGRPWDEVVSSSLLTLRIAEMVRERTRFGDFSFSQVRRELAVESNEAESGDSGEAG